MTLLLYPLAFVSLLLSGAIFGFFYAWLCSAMWGLDLAPPEIAIAAMQSMNAAVRNAVFAPAFFGTPLVLTVTALVAVKARRTGAALCFGLAAAVYAGGAFLPTALVNVPMNEALAEIVIADAQGSLEEIWTSYSGPWQVWNGIRTISSALSLLLAGTALLLLKNRTA